MKELGERKREILIATVEDYIKDASPITSSGIKNKHQINVSSATLRAELNALEAMGFLKQLHTSGGRVPTTEGYRFYVTYLLKDMKVDEKKIDSVRETLEQRTKSISEIVSELAKIISEATNYPTVILMNGYDKLILEELKVIPLIGDETLILMKTTRGIINNSVKISASQKSCEDAGRLLTKKFAGKTIGNMIENFGEVEKALASEINDYKGLVENLLTSIKELVFKKSMGIKQSGSMKLLSSGEEKTLDGAKKVFSLLENEEELTQILSGENSDVCVEVKEENDNSAGFSIVKAPIIVGGETVGTVGVLGPQRMDYGLIASALKFVSNELEALDKLEDKGGNDG